MKWIFLLSLFIMSCVHGESKEVEVVSIKVTDRLGLDSTLYFLDKIDNATATLEELDRARPYFIKSDSLIKTEAKYLMQAGLVLMSGDNGPLYGLNYLIFLTKKFPMHDFAPEALMQLALYFDTTLGDKERSTDFLKSLIDRYPKHELVPSAKSLLELNLSSKQQELETVRTWLNNQ